MCRSSFRRLASLQVSPSQISPGRLQVALSWLLIGLLALGSVACGPERGARKDWNVLLVTFDTTRADHIGCYGNADVRTPNLDRLAAEGVLFEHAYSAVPVTAPSHSTILTGLYPTGHGVRDNGLFMLGEAQTTLAEMLAEVGYATAAAVGSFPLASQFGLSQGFDLYDDHFTLPYEDFRGHRVVIKDRLFFDERPAELVNEPLLPWLEEHHDEPFFAWAHYFDPHLPAEPPPPYDELYLADPYLGEIAYADEAFGKLLARLEELGVADETLVIMTADHGEGRGEHNEMTHSTLAYDSTLHVPMILRIPGVEGGLRVEPRVGTVDLVPTILDLLGLEADQPLHGRSMVPLIEGGGERTADHPRPQYAETLSPRLYHDLGELRVLYDRDYKYIFGPRPELYDLADDPRERNDLVHERPEIAAALEAKLERFVQEHAIDNAADQVAMDEETRRRLEALGYISTSGGETKVVEKLDGSGTPPQDRVADVNEVSTAKNELLNGRARTGLVLAEALLRRDPDNVFYLQIKAAAKMLLGETEESISTLEEILELNPHGLPNQEFVLQMVDTLFYDGQPERALRLLHEQQELMPTPLGQWYVASLEAALGNPEAQVAALERALELDETFSPARVDLAVRDAQRGDLERARIELERAILDRPYFSKSHYNYGILLLQLERPDEALHHFDRATVLQPNYPQAHFAIVSTSLGRGDRSRAEEHVRRLERLAPRNPLTLEARKALESSALESHPSTPDDAASETLP